MTATKGETRARLLDTALGLFTVHGVEGTSLQMIADALGVTKAAVYYHFKTKDEITEAVAEPGLRELDAVIEDAAAQRRRGAQIDHMLAGFVDVCVRHRALISLVLRDPGVTRSLATWWSGKENFQTRMMAMLADPADTASGIGRLVAAHTFIVGVALTAGSPETAALDDDTLRTHLLAVARRIMGRRN